LTLYTFGEKQNDGEKMSEKTKRKTNEVRRSK